MNALVVTDYYYSIMLHIFVVIDYYYSVIVHSFAVTVVFDSDMRDELI